MKKSLPLFMLASAGLMLVACGGGGSECPTPSDASHPETLTINFNSNGGSSVAPITVSYGEKAIRPVDPTFEGSTFAGWYEQPQLVTPFDWDLAVTSNWTLYAKWGSGSEPSPSSEPSSGPSSTPSSEPSSEHSSEPSSEITSEPTSTPISSETSQEESSESSESTSGTVKTFYLDASAVSWWDDADAVINAHYWCASSEGSAWPGVSMTLVEELKWSIEVPYDVEGFVFSRQDPAKVGTSSVWNQTVDATVIEGKFTFVLSGASDAESHWKGAWAE